MNLSLDPRVRKLIDKRVKSGKYATAKDVVSAAVMNLEQQEWLGDFKPGELDALLVEGERSIKQHGTLDGDAAFRARCTRRAHRGARKS